MRARLVDAAKEALLRCGHYARRLRQQQFPGVAVLSYHGVRDDRRPDVGMVFEGLHVLASELEAQCRLLRDTCDPISLASWRAAVSGDASLPRRPVLVTFDDGYRSVFTLARPILQRYGIPAVVFVCSEPVERRQLFWHDSVAREYGEAVVERLKAQPYAEWEEWRTHCARPADEGDPHAPLAVDDIRALADTPQFEVGAHTAAHAILARATREQQCEQLQRNKTTLEAWIERPVTAFAYPNGRPQLDYTAETVELVRQQGFEWGFTTRHGFAHRSEPPLERSRLLMLAGISAAELAHRLCYSWRRAVAQQ